MFTNSPSSLTFVRYQKRLVLIEQSILMARCSVTQQLNRMSTCVKNKVQMCLVTQHHCVDFAKCVENVHKFTQITHFLSVTKNDLSSPNNLLMARFNSLVCPLMLKKTTDVLCSDTQHQCRWRKMCGKCSKFTKYTHCPYLSWLNNLFMAMFQLTRMSSYAKNKLQMCSVTQHQCRRR